jgi:rSAM/selenodomain-associated transferase 2
MTHSLSIIIPTLNEEHVLGRTLSQLQHKKYCEVIVVDGGSRDTTLELAQKSGCRIITSPKGRGRQMNLGAAIATGEILLFLHADTVLPEDFPGLIFDALNHPFIAAGAFSLAIDSPSKSLAAIAFFANLRSRFLHLPYGDQGLFTKRKTFNTIGGFPEMEIMEDFVFIQKIRKEGKIVILPECVTTSARRWKNMGIIRTTLINQLIVCGYKLGVPPVMLAQWYRRMRGVGKPPQ